MNERGGMREERRERQWQNSCRKAPASGTPHSFSLSLSTHTPSSPEKENSFAAGVYFSPKRECVQNAREREREKELTSVLPPSTPLPASQSATTQKNARISRTNTHKNSHSGAEIKLVANILLHSSFDGRVWLSHLFCQFWWSPF